MIIELHLNYKTVFDNTPVEIFFVYNLKNSSS